MYFMFIVPDLTRLPYWSLARNVRVYASDPLAMTGHIGDEVSFVAERVAPSGQLRSGITVVGRPQYSDA